VKGSNFSAADPQIQDATVHKSNFTLICCTGYLHSRWWVHLCVRLASYFQLSLQFRPLLARACAKLAQVHLSQTPASTRTSKHKIQIEKCRNAP